MEKVTQVYSACKGQAPYDFRIQSRVQDLKFLGRQTNGHRISQGQCRSSEGDRKAPSSVLWLLLDWPSQWLCQLPQRLSWSLQRFQYEESVRTFGEHRFPDPPVGEMLRPTSKYTAVINVHMRTVRPMLSCGDFIFPLIIDSTIEVYYQSLASLVKSHFLLDSKKQNGC